LIKKRINLSNLQLLLVGKAAELYFQSGMTATKEELAVARKEGMEQARNETPINE
jgi:hypothetical protein